MIPIHPSNIKMAEQYCQYTLKLLHDDTPYDRRVFQTGVAAHYILEVLGKKANQEQRELSQEETTETIETICKELVSKTRYYDGVPEPPMPLQDIHEAKLITEKWTRWNTLPHDANYEEEFAFDKDMNPCTYNDPNAIFRTIIDMVHVYKDEDQQTVAHVRDYKSSWYITGQLDNIQRKAQAVVVWMKYRPDVLIMDVTSIRTGQTISREIQTLPSEPMLYEWADFIKLAALKLTQINKLIPQPGLNCYQCPFASSCRFAVEFANKSNHVVKKYSAAKALAKSLESEVKAITLDNPITQGNTTVGFVAKETKALHKNANEDILNAALQAGWDIYEIFSYINLTRTQAEKILKDLPQEQKDKLEHVLTTKITTRFGIHK
jgi:hypothetical protein